MLRTSVHRVTGHEATALARSMSTMFDKILIANRGEIACRVMRTAKRLGVKTVAVYSEADAGSQHAALADEAVCIGPPPAAESYLRGDHILEVAAATGAQAVHPGYGFLSENAGFAAACASAGVTFIGPPESAILDMGSKSASKVIMTDAGVPVTPGYHGEDQSEALIAEEAAQIGYPVMLKAVLGGGGKGMRIVWSAEELPGALEACKREAKSSFGDDRVLVERYLTKPRHVELQVFADTHGNAVYLFERDCSVQRRHQKVLEEAPAPGMSEALRARMGASAVDAAKAVGYVGAGTVEFMLDEDESYYFMEMNTRLQVEHPVTEMITGVDLVEWQLRVAAGEPLPVAQEDLAIHGHSIEARVYAENPANNFLPATGTLRHLRTPTTSDSVRVDTGVTEGDEVSVFYDPMISKLICHGPDRPAALRQLANALEEYQIVGLPTNIRFLRSALAHPAFQEGGVDTSFLDKYLDDVLPPEHPETPKNVVAVAAFAALRRFEADAEDAAFVSEDPFSPWAAGNSGRPTNFDAIKLNFADGDDTVTVAATPTASGWALDVDGTTFDVSGDLNVDGTSLTATVNGHRATYSVVPDDASVHVFTSGLHGDAQYTLGVPAPDFGVAGAGAGDGVVVTPLPGIVTKTNVAVGDTVEEGEPLLILLAMKMEHTIKAPISGVIKAINVSENDSVNDGDVLVEFESEEEED